MEENVSLLLGLECQCQSKSRELISSKIPLAMSMPIPSVQLHEINVVLLKYHMQWKTKNLMLVMLKKLNLSLRSLKMKGLRRTNWGGLVEDYN